MSEQTLPIEHGEIAGIAGLFGALTRVELHRAVSTLCEHRGHTPADGAIDAAIEQALAACRLLVAPLAVDPPLGDAPIVVGPCASPASPADAGWLLDQLDIEPRELDADAVLRAADTELSKATERARNGETAVSVDDLVSTRERLSEWHPVTIDPTAALAERTPVEVDELAGIVEPFGALTRLELRQAVSVLCYRRGTEASESALETILDQALAARALLVAPRAVESSLGDAPIVVGPMATPTLPAAFDDLSGLLGIEPRPIDPQAVIRAAHTDRDRVDETTGATPALPLLDEAIERWEPTALGSPTICEVAEAQAAAGAADGAESESETTDETDATTALDSTGGDEEATTTTDTVGAEYLLAAPPAEKLPDIPLETDELAGIVDLFGALTRAELRQAISELCYRQGVDVALDSLDVVIDDALAAFVLLAAPGATAEPLETVPLVAGPAAFPAHPDHAEDLPHILDIDHRATERAVLRDAAVTQLQAAVDVVETEQSADPARLLELCYDLETWGAVALDEARQHLQHHLE